MHVIVIYVYAKDKNQNEKLFLVILNYRFT